MISAVENITVVLVPFVVECALYKYCLLEVLKLLPHLTKCAVIRFLLLLHGFYELELQTLICYFQIFYFSPADLPKNWLNSEIIFDQLLKDPKMLRAEIIVLLERQNTLLLEKDDQITDRDKIIVRMFNILVIETNCSFFSGGGQ